MGLLGRSVHSVGASGLRGLRSRGLLRPTHLCPTFPKCLVLLAAVFALHTPLLSQTAGTPARGPNENAVKANIVRSILSFVEWPRGVLSEGGIEDLTICVLGNDPFGEELDLAVEGRAVGGKAISIERSDDFYEVGFCHLLFISSSEEGHLSQVLLFLENLPTLTVSDMNGFAENGGMIGLEVVDSKIGLAVNLGVVEQSDLKLSSRLLRLARLVMNGLTAMEP